MKIPALKDVHPPLGIAEAKRADGYARISALRTEAITIGKRIDDSAPLQGNADENKLRAAVGDKPLPEVLPDHEQLAKVRDEITVLANASQYLDGVYQREKAIASQKLCEAASGEHTAHVPIWLARSRRFTRRISNIWTSLLPLKPRGPALPICGQYSQPQLGTRAIPAVRIIGPSRNFGKMATSPSKIFPRPCDELSCWY